MASWALEFCLACDKQVHSENAAYCSESCRLAELEKTSAPSTPVTSPGFSSFTDPWAATTKRQPTPFYLAPAYDFRNAQPYGTSSTRSTASRPSAHTLTPSSSHSSLSSMQSTANTPAEAAQLSEQTRKELTAYAISFEQVRTHRRRSY